MIEKFENLPDYIQKYYKLLYPSASLSDPDFYNKLVLHKIPALKNKSIMEVINEPGGEEAIVRVCNEYNAFCSVPYTLYASSEDGPGWLEDFDESVRRIRKYLGASEKSKDNRNASDNGGKE